MSNSLKGQFLLATPSMGDRRFFESLIILIDHSIDGAMGIVVNHPIKDLLFSEILSEMALGDKNQIIKISKQAQNKIVFRGGPVETGRGFVLHSKDYSQEKNTFAVNNDINLSATSEILKEIAFGSPPKKSLFALGYCGWSAGQLENELKDNGWLIAPYTSELLFSVPVEKKYDFALNIIGATRASLSPISGSA